MRTRIWAGAAGAVLIAAAVLAFSLGKHPIVVGTNTTAPLLPAVGVQGGQTRCQASSRIPSGSDHLRVVVSSISGQPGYLTVGISGTGGRAATSGRGLMGPAGRVIRLRSVTRAVHPARICFQYSGPGQVILAGEKKRVPAEGRANPGPKRAAASVVFLRSGLSSWASRRGLIADRYANSQARPFGLASLWLAVIAAIAAAGLALGWVVFRLEPRPDPSRRPR